MNNPFSSVEPWSLVADGYNETTRNLLRPYSEIAVGKLPLNDKHHILDVACGPGTTSLILLERVARVSAIDFSPEMLACLARNINSLKNENKQKLELFEMDGQHLDFADASFDHAISMFGLMFFPDRIQGMREIYRVLKPGGQVAISSWVPSTESPLMQIMFAAVQLALPDAPPRKNVAGLDDPEVFHSELSQAGFANIKIEKIDNLITVEEAMPFFDDMLKGSAPLQMLKANHSESDWQVLEKKMRRLVEQELGKLPATYNMPAYLGLASKPV